MTLFPFTYNTRPAPDTFPGLVWLVWLTLGSKNLSFLLSLKPQCKCYTHITSSFHPIQQRKETGVKWTGHERGFKRAQPSKSCQLEIKLRTKRNGREEGFLVDRTDWKEKRIICVPSPSPSPSRIYTVIIKHTIIIIIKANLSKRSQIPKMFQ